MPDIDAIDDAIIALTDAPFAPDTFALDFLRSYGYGNTTIVQLEREKLNKSDIGGVLLPGNIHIKVARPGMVGETLKEILASKATNKKANKVGLALATDGETLRAEDLREDESLDIPYGELAEHTHFFYTLAGIKTSKHVDEKIVDVKATRRMGSLYDNLVRNNPAWGNGNSARMNEFMARLIFCFFAEDTGIFDIPNMFTRTVLDKSEANGGNIDTVIGEIFRVMNIEPKDRAGADIRPYAKKFPYVNGGLFSGDMTVPAFTRRTKAQFERLGRMNWNKINPDIFGSMIQAIADEDERANLGMHYTSRQNILKVLNPLFLDGLREVLDFISGKGGGGGRFRYPTFRVT